jgi:hypothetical protein
VASSHSPQMSGCYGDAFLCLSRISARSNSANAAMTASSGVAIWLSSPVKVRHPPAPAAAVLPCLQADQQRWMNDAKASVVVGGEGSFDGCADVVVVPDGGGEGEDALSDADDDSCDGVAAVLVEVELTLKVSFDRLDGLAQQFEESGTGSLGFALAGRAEQVQAGLGEGGFEVVAEVVPVRRSGLPGSVVGQGGIGEDVQ